jgi:hypothetical protein
MNRLKISQAPARERKLAGAFDLSSPIFIGRMSVVDALSFGVPPSGGQNALVSLKAELQTDRLKAELQTEDQPDN